MTSNDLIEIESILPEEQRQAISIDLEEAKEKSQSLRVVNDESLDEANALCMKIKNRQKGIEQFRLAIVKPLKDHIAKIDSFFKGLALQFDGPFELASNKATVYREKKIRAEREEREKLETARLEKERKERERLAKLEEEARAKGRDAEAERLKKAQAEVKIETPAPKKEAPAKSTYQEGVGRTTYVKDAEYRIEDPNLVPDEFYVLDEKKIGARVRENRKTLEVGKVYRDIIPGVVVTCIERPSFAGEK